MVVVRLRDGRWLESRLLLAADGASSHVRQLTGIGSDGRDYQQKGIVARVQTEHSHQATAWQRFMPTGPLAFLPLADGSCSVVWSADNHFAEELMACSDDEFARHLGAGVEYRLGKVEMLSKRGAFPLFMSHAKSYTAGRVVLLGDAAHRVHPLAGQGVNLGFQDVAHLVATLDQARKNDRTIDDPMYLRRFSRERRAQAALMIAGMDGIQRVFSNELPIVNTARGLGMQLINRVPQIKQFFVDRALGN
jgi:2-octaprenylphenol hydroxylase